MLTKNEILKIISESAEIPMKDVKIIFQIYTSLVKSELINTGEIKFPDVGKFKVKITPKRNARNPITGETFETSPKPKIKFVANKDIKEAIAKIKWQYVKK